MKRPGINTPLYAFVGMDFDGSTVKTRWWIGASVRADMAPRAWQPVPCD